MPWSASVPTRLSRKRLETKSSISVLPAKKWKFAKPQRFIPLTIQKIAFFIVWSRRNLRPSWKGKIIGIATFPGSWNGNRAPFLSAAFFLTGRLSHTKYILYNSPSRVKVTRRHHPLYDQELEVLNSDRQVLVVRLADGSPMKMPRAWTDANGAVPAQEPTLLSAFTFEALRELLNLLDTLRNRD